MAVPSACSGSAHYVRAAADDQSSRGAADEGGLCCGAVRCRAAEWQCPVHVQDLHQVLQLMRGGSAAALCVAELLNGSA